MATLPPTCLICSKSLEDQKPLLLVDETSSEKLSEFKESFLCFCKLLNISGGRNAADKILDKALSNVLLGVSSSSEECVQFGGVPCCGECCGALSDLVRIQKAIDELKISQMDNAEGLKLSLLSSVNDVLEDVWTQTRKELIACILNRPIILESQQTIRSSLPSTRRLPNILRRNSRRSNAAFTSVSANIKEKDSTPNLASLNPVSFEEFILPNETTAGDDTFCDGSFDESDTPVLSPFLSPPSPIPDENQQPQLPLTNQSTGSSRGVSKLVRPCSIVLERLSPQAIAIKQPQVKLESQQMIPTDKKVRNSKRKALDFLRRNVKSQNLRDDEGDYYEDVISELIQPQAKIPRQCHKSPPSGPIVKYNYGNLFYLIDESTLLCKYTIIKMTHGGTQFTCMEAGCSMIFSDPDCYALFDKMQSHVESIHGNGKQKMKRTCPLCQEEFKMGTQLRWHLMSRHLLKTVVCESCWKPIRHVADTYRIHKWRHKNKQEQAETEGGPPKQLLYKQRIQMENRRKRLLRKSGKLDSEDSDYEPKRVALKTRVSKGTTSMVSKIKSTPTSKPLVTTKTYNLVNKIKQISTTENDQRPSRRMNRNIESERSKIVRNTDSEEDQMGNDSGDDLVTTPEASDDDHDYVPEKTQAASTKLKKSPVKLNKPLAANISVTPANSKNRQKGFKLNDKFWLVNEDHLLYKYTLIQVSNGGTQLTCLEHDCTVTLQNLNYLDLFEQMKAHVESSHAPNDPLYYELLKEPAQSPSLRTCPHVSCHAEVQNGRNFRIHLFTAHFLVAAACEVCWKPINLTGAAYPIHRWSHKSDLEKLQEPPPQQVIYKAMLAKKPATKTKLFLKKMGIDLQEVAESPVEKVKLHRTTRDENFSQLSDNLLLYKYTVLKMNYGQGISCNEPGCSSGLIASGTDYAALKQVKEHVKEWHFGETYFSKSRHCPICEDEDNVFSDGCAFRRHLLEDDKHASSCSYLCQSCWKPIKTRGHMQIHVKTHQPLISNGDVKTPKLTSGQYQKQRGEFPCSECGRIFNTKANLYNHAPSHLPKEIRKQWSCTQCHGTFLSRVALRNHTERLHQADASKFRHCPICNQRFFWRDGYSFRAHMRSHANERPFVCDLCGMAFNTKYQFDKHQNVHAEVRAYQCEYCEMSYKHSSNLKRHRETAHKDKVAVRDKEERLKLTHYRYRPDFIGPKIAFPCEYCDKVFALRSRMTKHVKLCHLGVMNHAHGDYDD